jgi:hypothetical protein
MHYILKPLYKGILILNQYSFLHINLQLSLNQVKNMLNEFPMLLLQLNIYMLSKAPYFFLFLIYILHSQFQNEYYEKFLLLMYTTLQQLLIQPTVSKISNFLINITNYQNVQFTFLDIIFQIAICFSQFSAK